MPAIRSSRRSSMTRRAPTNFASSTSPPATKSAALLLDVVRRTAEVCFMPLTVGGGVRTLDDIRALLLAGADKVSINTEAVSPAGIRARGGGEIRQPVHRRRHRRQAGARTGTSYRSLHPWRAHAPPASMRSPMPGSWSNMARAKSCSPPWTATAPSPAMTLPLTRAIADAVPVPVIASGGVGTLEDLVGGRDRRPCQRRAGRLDLPFRRGHHRRGQGRPCQGRTAGAAGLIAPRLAFARA